MLVVHVAKGRDVLGAGGLDVRKALAADGDAADVQQVAGRDVSGPAQDAAGHDHQAGRGAGCGAEKRPAGQAGFGGGVIQCHDCFSLREDDAMGLA